METVAFSSKCSKCNQRIRVLEIEAEKLKKENKELQRANEDTSASWLNLQIEDTDETVAKDDELNFEENTDLQESPEQSSKGTSVEADSPFQKFVKGRNGNLRKSRPQKRKTSEEQQQQQEMFLTMVGFGLSQLIEDEETPVTMLGSLKALKHYTTFTAKDEDKQSQQKRKKLQKIQKVVKEEYFEFNEVKNEPVEHEKSDQASKHQQALERRENDMLEIREERDALRTRVQLLEEGQTKDVTIMDKKMEEISDMKEELEKSELRNQRLLEAFKKTTGDFRHVVFQLTGYRIDVLPDDKYRMTPWYAQSLADQVLFEKTISGELQMLESEYSLEVGELRELHLDKQIPIPVFLADLIRRLWQNQGGENEDDNEEEEQEDYEKE